MKDFDATVSSNNQVCACCNRCIPKFVKRLSLGYRTRYGSAALRVCEVCINELSKKVNKKSVKQWEEQLEQKRLKAAEKEEQNRIASKGF